MTSNFYGKMTRADLASDTIDWFHYIYSEKGNIDMVKSPVERSAFLITYWPSPDKPRPFDNSLDIFGQLNWKYFLRPTLIGPLDNQSAMSRQHFGFCALDYRESRNGYRTQGEHLHGVLITHPSQRLKTLLRMQLISTLYDRGLSIKSIKPTPSDLYETVTYCLKGIMSKERFYHGRSDAWRRFGPKN